MIPAVVSRRHSFAGETSKAIGFRQLGKQGGTSSAVTDKSIGDNFDGKPKIRIAGQTDPFANGLVNAYMKSWNSCWTSKVPPPLAASSNCPMVVSRQKYIA
jgi:hypothetical protein